MVPLLLNHLVVISLLIFLRFLLILFMACVHLLLHTKIINMLLVSGEPEEMVTILAPKGACDIYPALHELNFGTVFASEQL